MSAKTCHREQQNRHITVRAYVPPDGPHILTMTLCPDQTKVAEVKHSPGSETTDILLLLNRKNVCRTSTNVVMITRALDAVLHGLVSVRSDTTCDHGWTVVLWYVHLIGARNPVVYDYDRWLRTTTTAAVCNKENDNHLLVPSLVSAARRSALPFLVVDEEVQPALPTVHAMSTLKEEPESVVQQKQTTSTQTPDDAGVPCQRPDDDLVRRLMTELERERASHRATQQELHELELQMLLRDDDDNAQSLHPRPRPPEEKYKYIAVPEPEAV